MTSMTQSADPSYHTVIGLAGHVDHGKTSLIQALTGIMTARPHEQSLGMTQDLGFAHFVDDQNNTIGVIDVPGHERYLRNMVAGVWCINVLLLVISAEEGCMPMTLTHTKVAATMGVKHIVIALNKCDKVSKEQLADVEEQALETIMDISGIVPDIVPVSAHTGENVALLKQTLIGSVRDSVAQTPSPVEQSPYLYVDRAFVVNGVGTIVTGTLARGCIKLGDKLHCPSAGVTGVVRSLQTYNQQVEQAQATSRVAINIKGLSKKQVKRGDLLIAATDDKLKASAYDQCILRIKAIDEASSEHKRNKQVEVASGSWHSDAKLIPLPNTSLARLILPKTFSFHFGQKMMVIQSGGKKLLFQGEVVWFEPIASFQKRAVYQALSELPDSLSHQDQLAMLIKLQGYYPALLSAEHDTDNTQHLGDYIVAKSWFEQTCQAILALLEQGQSLSSNEISDQLKVTPAILPPLLAELKKSQQIHLNYGKWHFGNGVSEDDLPEQALEILNLTRKAGLDGLELNKVDLSSDKKWLRQLAHQKYITSLTDEIYYDMQVYLDLVKAILGTRQPQETTDIQAMKDITHLSRKYIIPLANRMEKDGWIRRDGDHRIILKAWQEMS